MSDQDIFAALAAPFPVDRISWRVGSVKKDGTAAMALAYIDARDVMERLDEVCGPAAWQCDYPHANGKTVCRVGIKVGDEWVWKADGAGDSDIEAEKGALSDAFKRAAVRWGIGRYLYDVKSPWVRIDQYKKILPEEVGKLQASLPRPKGTARASAPQPEPPPAEPDGAGARKSSSQAKKDGDDVKIKSDIAKCDRDGLRDWHANFDSHTAHLPYSWLSSIHDMLELRLEELTGAERVADQEAELDADFRQTVAGRVADSGTQVAA